LVSELKAPSRRHLHSGGRVEALHCRHDPDVDATPPHLLRGGRPEAVGRDVSDDPLARGLAELPVAVCRCIENYFWCTLFWSRRGIRYWGSGIVRGAGIRCSSRGDVFARKLFVVASDLKFRPVERADSRRAAVGRRLRRGALLEPHASTIRAPKYRSTSSAAPPYRSSIALASSWSSG
jgi:hypothetical protein